MDITDCLKKDHDEALELARRMSRQDDAESARTLYKTLRNALTAHSRAEEAVVYRALDRLALREVSEMTQEGEVEHDLCDHLLGLLARGRADSALWKARAVVVLELLEHHIEEEQDEMFKLLRQHFDVQERAAMGERFVRHKDKPPVSERRAASD